MLGRAVVAFLALPGMVAYVVPVILARPDAERSGWQWTGVLPIFAGTLLLLWCVRDFYTAGRGTLAPWAPPRNLVIMGLYRWSRNPMYVAVLGVIAGWSIWYSSVGLLLYGAVVALAFHLRIVLFEEPWLARTHNEQWSQYSRQVRRWF